MTRVARFRIVVPMNNITSLPAGDLKVGDTLATGWSDIPFVTVESVDIWEGTVVFVECSQGYSQAFSVTELLNVER